VNRQIVKYLIFIAFFLLFQKVAFGSDALKKVLLVNSYNSGYSWTDEQTNGILQGFEGYPDVLVYIEYLDAKHFPEKHKKAFYFDYFSQKYAQDNFDLIISTDNDALDFVLSHAESPLFKGISHVSCGIGNPEAYSHIDNLHIVHEIILYRQDIKIFAKIFPDMEEFVFITDKLTTGQIYRDDIRQIFEKNYPEVNLIIYDCIDLDNLASDMQQFDFPTVIYNAGMSIDCRGEPINSMIVADIIQKNTRAPLISGQFCGQIDNYIGGISADGVLHGAKATEIAIEVLFAQNTDLQKVYTSETLPVFDYKLLKKHKISKALIPADSILVNTPETFWTKNKRILIISGAIIANLILIIVMLYRGLVIQKRLRKDLFIAMEKANQSNVVKTVFLENVSHEMRTPLNSIVGFSDVLSETIHEEESLNYLKIISESAQSLNNIISDIFDFSLLKSHRTEIDLSDFSFRDLLDDILAESSLKNQLAEKPVNIVEDFEKSCKNLKITGDREKTFQVLKHILGNALKFTNEGVVEIKCRLSNSNTAAFPDKSIPESERKFVIIGIKDTGIGIKPEFITDVFDPFRQANDDLTNANRGLGLGLSISKFIIEILGGKIQIQSKPELGTSVIFSIPLEIRS
jgi:signal transduction histidine kinase